MASATSTAITDRAVGCPGVSDGHRGAAGEVTAERAHDPSPDHHRRDAGFVLVTVIWLIGLTALMALSFASQVRVHAAIGRNAVANAEAEALADAGVMLAVHRHLKAAGEATGAVQPVVGTLHVCRLTDGARLATSVQDEAGKVDLNVAGEGLIRAMMIGFGVPPSDADSLVAALLDFRDPDDARRPNGAEAPEYAAAGRAKGPKNGSLESTEELGDVVGFTPELVARLRPFLTVHSGQSGIDPRSAHDALLAAVAAGDDEVGDNTAASRLHAAPELLPPKYVNPSARQAVSISVLAVTAHGARFIRAATVGFLHPRPQRSGPALANPDSARRPRRGSAPAVKFWTWQRTSSFPGNEASLLGGRDEGPC